MRVLLSEDDAWGNRWQCQGKWNKWEPGVCVNKSKWWGQWGRDKVYSGKLRTEWCHRSYLLCSTVYSRKHRWLWPMTHHWTGSSRLGPSQVEGRGDIPPGECWVPGWRYRSQGGSKAQVQADGPSCSVIWALPLPSCTTWAKKNPPPRWESCSRAGQEVSFHPKML